MSGSPIVFTDPFEFRVIVVVDPCSHWQIPIGLIWRFTSSKQVSIIKVDALPTTYPNAGEVRFIRSCRDNLNWTCGFDERPNSLGPYVIVKDKVVIDSWAADSPESWMKKAVFKGLAHE